jgi:DnaJ-class molecular chaperone
MSDACSRCKGHGEVPRVPGDYSTRVPCSKCHGTGRRGG